MNKLKKMSKEELELLSYTDIAELYLTETKKTKNTAELFKIICELLELTDNEYSEQIADFFQSLTTSKRFILLDNGEWDLKSNHSIKVVLDEDTEDEEENYENEEEKVEEEPEEEPDDIDAINNDDDDGYIEDEDEDLSDLTIVDEDDLEEE